MVNGGCRVANDVSRVLQRARVSGVNNVTYTLV